MLGLKLLTRNSRGVELTEAGRAFLIGGRRVLVAAKEAAERALEAAQGERGRLVIGSLGAATIPFLSPVLSRFREQHPIGSCPSTRSLLLGTSNGCAGFANGSALLKQRYQPKPMRPTPVMGLAPRRQRLLTCPPVDASEHWT